MLKGCLVAFAVVVLLMAVLRLAFGLLGWLAGILAIVPMPVWIIGAVIILVWALRRD